MSAKNLRRMVVAAVAVVCVSASFVRADKMALQEQLSKEVKIQLKDVTIAEALEKLGEKAGVKFVLSDEAVWKLPYGEATRLSVAMDGPLAESMTEMLNAFFMRYAVGSKAITIYPRPELEHILGRPTAGQLELLKKMYTMVFTFGYAGSGAVIKTMIGEVFPDVAIVPVGYYSRLSEIVEELTHELPEGKASPRVTLTQMLDSVGEAWYLSGMDFPNKITEIRIVDDIDFRFAKLDQIVDISFEEEDAEVIIQRLANWAGMELIVDKNETSWLVEDPITVDMQNIKLRQAILNIVTTVDGGVEIDIGDNEIGVYGPKHPRKVSTPAARTRGPRTAARPARSASEGYVGKISIPMDGGKYYIEFMLRESDLTEQLRKLREEKMTEILGERPKPKPAAKPTTAESKK